MSTVGGPALLALCCAVVVACSAPHQGEDQRRLVHDYTDIDRFGYVIANAFRATHPEYRLTEAGYAQVHRADEMAIELRIEPALTSDIVGSAKAIFSVRQDGTSGRIYYTDTYNRTLVSVRDVVRQLDAKSPQLPVLTAALSHLGRRDDKNVPSKKVVDDELKRAGRAKEVTAVVELEDPLTASDIRSRGYLSLNNAVFLPASSGGAPIAWDYYPTWFCSTCGGDDRHMTSDFQTWVSFLQPSDDAALRPLGLSLARLREAAHSGKIYGYVEYDANPDLLRELLKKDYVKTMYLVRTRKYCMDSALGECVPGRWPKTDHLYG
ncbi:hypothetical protein Sme01_72580 [Sphaerisporangium melleum]|uniref:Uncharacterized protein n=1 Tax=Sphaerisporangium melleum TaxID=321316 RepID=A0A917VVH5_9ACTN|nr:hypothetical protein [Sphaerisporangium melleum]GGL18409.1 hypothetical protein GCM10007964_70550 [Sphaerisporangium melleum]GII74782.1 hypothetical protein Sme01_72580 [Sphaerisporangium melleum]